MTLTEASLSQHDIDNMGRRKKEVTFSHKTGNNPTSAARAEASAASRSKATRSPMAVVFLGAVRRVCCASDAVQLTRVFCAGDSRCLSDGGGAAERYRGCTAA